MRLRPLPSCSRTRISQEDMEASESSWVIENTKSMATASDRVGARNKRRAPRVETTRNEVAKGQDQQFTRNATMDVSEAFTPPSKCLRRPIETVNPLHRRGRLKTNPRKVSQANPLTSYTVASRPYRASRIVRNRCIWTVQGALAGAILEAQYASTKVLPVESLDRS